MIHDSVVSCIGQTPLVWLRRMFPPDSDGLKVIAKLEMLNPGGSVKDRPARYIIEDGLRTGAITAKTQIIESSSGNLGIALAMTARIYGLNFTCVVDPKISKTNRKILEQLGAQVDMVHDPDDQGGYLKTRVRRVQELLRTLPHSVWINQYANELNLLAHYYGTGGEILDQLDVPLDVLVLAVSTAGTIMGISRRLRERFPMLRVVAVDAAGSIIFGAPAGPRELPGIGSSRVPELLRADEIDEVVYATDWEAVVGCRRLLATEGILAGGSSGSIMAAIEKLRPSLSPHSTILTVLPDRGERYLDTVYDDAWVECIRDSAHRPAATVMMSERVR